MTYLGRLDPMAEGLLLVLSGNTKNKNKYLDLDKEYEFEALWGFESDTYDTLGLVKGDGSMPDKIEQRMEAMLDKVRSKKVQVYPPYSSRTVNGKPLFEYARENKIEEIDIPERGIKIFSIKHIHTRLLQKAELQSEIEQKINLVKGDFRQAQILQNWSNVLENSREESFLVSKFIASVSSGTYIRSLVKDMGEYFKTSALAYSIKRTRVGKYNLTM